MGKNRGWRRIWIPSYFCQDVVSSILSTGIKAKVYYDSPELAVPNINLIRWQRGDVLLLINYFGLRGKPYVREKIPSEVEVI